MKTLLMSLLLITCLPAQTNVAAPDKTFPLISSITIIPQKINPKPVNRRHLQYAINNWKSVPKSELPNGVNTDPWQHGTLIFEDGSKANWKYFHSGVLIIESPKNTYTYLVSKIKSAEQPVDSNPH
jgi:hypothetical protein